MQLFFAIDFMSITLKKIPDFKLNQPETGNLNL